jgi:DNA repair protein RecO (recombination protein O)
VTPGGARMPPSTTKQPRVHDEPAFVLHHHDWSEASLILEVFSRHHGRVALVAKGVKRPSSQFRPVLLPLQALRLGWGGDAEVRTLKAAHWQGGHVMPSGDALLAGYYLNELLLKLLARDDAHPVLFDHYAQAVRCLAEPSETRSGALRAFELLLLREVGWLPALDHEGASLHPLDPTSVYLLLPEAGLRAGHPDDPHGLQGRTWQALQQALDQPRPFEALQTVCAEGRGRLRRQLGALLHYHCGVRAFHTRELVRQAQGLWPVPPDS